MAELTDKQQALLEELLKDFKGDARDIFGEGGLLKTIARRCGSGYDLDVYGNSGFDVGAGLLRLVSGREYQCYGDGLLYA